MNDDGFDTDLRGRFQELRSRELADVPDFETMLAAARETVAAETETESVVSIRRRKPRIGSRGLAMASAAVAAALAVIWLAPSDGSDAVGVDEFDALVRSYSQQSGGGSWRAPTDGLLEVPGIELVRSVPTIGGYQLPVGAMTPAGDNG